MESLFLSLLDKGGLLGLLVAVALMILMTGVMLRQKGVFSFGDKTRVVGKDRLTSIDNKLGGIDRRLIAVEDDLNNRPTRAEIHDLELSLARLEGKVSSIDKTLSTMSHAVVRIEDFLINLSRGKKA